MSVRTALLGGLGWSFGLEELRVLPVTLDLQLGRWNEAHRRRVHAVAQSGRARAVIEDVTEMRIGVRRPNLGAAEAKETICLRANVRGLERPCKAWPPSAGIIFVEGAEERLSGNDVDIDPGFVIIPINIPERSLRVLALGHRVLERCELPPDLAVTRLHESFAWSGGWRSRCLLGLRLRRCGEEKERSGLDGRSYYSIVMHEGSGHRFRGLPVSNA